MIEFGLLCLVLGAWKLARVNRARGSAEYQGIAPSWTDTDQLAPGVDEWLKAMHTEPPARLFTEPHSPATNGWYTRRFVNLSRIHELRQRAAWRRIDVALGPDLAELAARHYEVVTARLAEQDRINVEAEHLLAAIFEPTGPQSVIEVERAEWVLI